MENHICRFYLRWRQSHAPKEMDHDKGEEHVQQIHWEMCSTLHNRADCLKIAHCGVSEYCLIVYYLNSGISVHFVLLSCCYLFHCYWGLVCWTDLPQLQSINLDQNSAVNFQNDSLWNSRDRVFIPTVIHDVHSICSLWPSLTEVVDSSSEPFMVLWLTECLLISMNSCFICSHNCWEYSVCEWWMFLHHCGLFCIQLEWNSYLYVNGVGGWWEGVDIKGLLQQ